ncbi:MAG: EAL domain-containing protein [Betaproteobacteria bacterium]|nr:MAG: EAL domain-containing protein [Betaproteobacteria bacterium]
MHNAAHPPHPRMAARPMSPPKLSLSIRNTVLLAIVLGVLVPALGLLALDQRIARRTHEPLVQRNRDAVMLLGADVLAEPLWTVNEAALRQGVDTLLRENNVCGAEVAELNPGPRPLAVSSRRCAESVRMAQRDTPILQDGKAIGRLRVWFDDGEIERLLVDRRSTVLWLVLVQALFGIAVLLGVLSLRLLRPIAKLKDQASAIAARTPSPPLAWRRRDELGQLGQHLNEVRARIDGLFEELERKNAQLRKMAMYDHLTGLPNRTLFRELFQHESAVAKRNKRSMAMLFIDLDRFKNVNDALGHAVGDELLLGTSQRLLQALRQSDLVCRHSGDEFLVLLRDADPWDLVASTADRLLRVIETPLPIGHNAAAAAHGRALPDIMLDRAGAQEAQVSASIGVALYPRDGEDFDTLVRHADLAMYKSKQLGRARYSFFHAELNEAMVARVDLERELAQAVAHNELVLHYQPVVEAPSGRLHGCEALVRWRHPQRGLLMPDAFIGVAEESGLIRELGAWTLDAACAQLARWKAAGRHPGRVAVNVSALQFRDQRLLETVQRVLREHAIGPGELELEITESTLMSDTEATQRTVAALRELGVALAVDDFGTGYSSLAYLKRLHPEKVKIDRSFVRDLGSDSDDIAVVQAIIRLGQALDFQIVGEGVETNLQRDLLLANGCRLLQGYRFARPLPAEAFEAWVDEAQGAIASER